MPTIKYPNNPNTDTAFVTDDNNHRTRAVKTAQVDGTIDYPTNPNSDSCYVTVDGKKQRALMVADISSEGTLDYPKNSNSTKGYVTVNGKKQRVTLTASLVGGGGSAPVIDELNVTPSTSAQTITAPSGVDGYSPVNVSAVDSTIDANIVAGNIKKDVQILGVTGSYEGQIPTGTMYIISNGTYNVADKAIANVQVPTTAPALYREFQLDSASTLIQNKTTTHIMNFTGIKDIENYMLAFAYYNNTAISGAVDMSDLTTLNGSYACYTMFQGCTGLTSVDMSSLTMIAGSYACNSMFSGCTGLTSVNMSSLTTVSANFACYGMFNGCTGLTSVYMSSLTTVSGSNTCNSMFYGCTGLTSVNMSSLTTVSGSNACQSMFSGCTGLTSVDMSSLTTITGTSACNSMFNGCTALTTVYIGGTTAIDFGTKTNQFGSMFQNCTKNIDVYAPAASQSAIEGFSGYPNFSGTGTVTWHWRS